MALEDSRPVDVCCKRALVDEDELLEVPPRAIVFRAVLSRGTQLTIHSQALSASQSARLTSVDRAVLPRCAREIVIVLLAVDYSYSGRVAKVSRLPSSIRLNQVSLARLLLERVEYLLCTVDTR